MEWLRMLAGVFRSTGRTETAQDRAAQPEPREGPTPEISVAEDALAHEHAIDGQPARESDFVVEDLSEAHVLVREICGEAMAARADRFGNVNLENSPRWIALKLEPPERQALVAWAAYRGVTDRNSPYYWRSLEHGQPRRAIFAYALRRLPFKSEWLLDLLQGWLKNDLRWNRDYTGRALMSAVERFAKQQALPPDLHTVLGAISDLIPAARHSMSNADAERLIERIERLLDPAAAERQKTLSPGPFADAIHGWLKTLNPGEREPWLCLVQLCVECGEKSSPSSKWLKQAKQAVHEAGECRIGDRLFDLLENVELPFSQERENLEKGLAWATTLLHPRSVAGDVGRLAEKWLRASPNRVGNAAVWALSQMAGEPRAAVELFRLRDKLKRHETRKLIDKRLEELAEKSGTTVEDLEIFALPSFGLDHRSRRSQDFGAARGELCIEAAGTTLNWTNGAGIVVKGVPTEVRKQFPEALADFQQQAKDVEAARQLQAVRLEQSWVEERSWSFQDWSSHFFQHPIRRPIVSALVWRIGGAVVFPEGEVLRDVSGNVRTFQSDERVSLWHPLNSDLAEVLSWRSLILDRGLTQPIKQAYREIYVLTDAERMTGTYSNRFAAHILRQHQFTKICQARSWRYKLMGDWDGWNQPTRVLPKQKMSVEFQVETVDGGDDRASSGIAVYLASDQVRFLDAEHQPVALETIAAVVFSEVMRDVDLFVAVTSVANDPNWSDGGPEGRHGDYWQRWAFGELGQTATMRRDLAKWLVPKLSIASKLEITEKSLVVQGKRQKYAIHFGSSNIQILPSNRYLCIVADRAPKETSNIKLPFEGDSLFSTILSKAFLLVDEDKIKDPTILRQL